MKLPFKYTHKTNKRSKSLKIKIEQGGKVVVVSPKFVPQFVIKQFVKKNQDWIIKNLKKATPGNKFNSDSHTFVFGKKYKRKIVFSKTKKTGIYVMGNSIILNPLVLPEKFIVENYTNSEKTTKNSVNSTIEDPILLKLKDKWNKKFQKKIDDFLKNTAGHYIVKRTHELSKIMNLSFNNITLRKQKTRWGSCSSQKNLNFNWKLVHFETDIIDYVIIHELAHLVQMNHSKKFWDLVREYDPEYLNHRGWLKRNGLSLD